MSAKRIELYSLPKIVVCENGEDCDTDDTHSSTTNGEEEDRGAMAEKANDQALDDATPKENPPAPKPASKPKPSKATVAEKQVEPNLRGNHDIDVKPPAKPPSKEARKAATIEETGELPSRYVGRVIGKGGEMIRDLQARSGCHIDVDQKVERGAPKNITYRGRKREDIDFAKHLVAMLCTEDAPGGADLPLGHAMVRQILVPDADVGRIIGRRGEMIRELQTRSQARIQVDHSKDHGGDGGTATKHRQVTITGTKDSVDKAEEMISLLSTNPHMDGHELLESVENWSGGDAHPDGSSHRRGYDDGRGGRQGSWNMNPYAYSPPAIMETEILPCEEADIGHIIGRRGATVIDLRRRSNCDIQIDPQRRRIIITGPRQGIETAKRMLRNVLERGSNHPYAGGRRLEQQGETSVLGCKEVQRGYSPCYAEQPMVPYQQQQQPFAIPQAPRRYSAPAPSPWRAAVAMDGRVYYYNQETLETRWEKPAEMR